MASPPQVLPSEFALKLSLDESEDQDRVKVYSAATTAKLAGTRRFAGNSSSIGQLLPRTGGAKRATSAQTAAARCDWLRSCKREVLRQKHEEQLAKTLARHRQGRAKKREDEHVRFDQLYDSLVAEEAGFITDVEAFLRTQARNQVRKREALHRQWDEEVYQKVQAEINTHLDQRPIADISARRYALMDEYVRVSNTKAHGLFRDIIIPEEYDPMTAHDPIKYDARLRHDPCKIELRQASKGLDAAAVSGFARDGDFAPRFPPTMWDKLEATPYGRFNKVMPPPMSLEEATTLRSAVVNDHFAIQRGRAVIDREFPMGKRCFPGARGAADNVHLGEEP